MRFLSFAIAFLLFLSMSSCDSNGTDEPIETVIGLAAPMTGSLARAGQSMRLAAEMTIALANDSLSEGVAPYRLMIEDTESTTDGAKKAFENLIASGVRFVVGPFTSTNTKHVTDLIDESQLLTIAPASAATGLSAESDWLFRSSLTVDMLLSKGVPAIHNHLRFDHIASMTNRVDTFSNSAYRKFVEKLAEIGGIRLDIKEEFIRFENEALPEIDSRIRTLLNSSQKLDAIFFFGQGPDRLHFILRAHELGLHNVPFVIPLLSTSQIRLARETNPLATDGIYVIHVWVSGNTNDASKEFVSAYQNRYGDSPNDQHARTYAAMKLLMKAIEETEAGNASSEEIRENLSAMRKVDTIYGPFSFDENGDAIYDPIIGVTNGRDIELLGGSSN